MADFSDEVLMRFADGELDDATTAAVELAMNGDERLAERVAVFMETRSLAQAALGPLSQEPVPDQLTRAVQAMVDKSRAETLQAPSVRSRRILRPANDWWPAAAAAASVAAVIGLAAGYWLANPQADRGLALAAVGDPALRSALASTPSGQELPLGGDRFRAIATVRDASRTLCREFEIDRTGGPTEMAVACRESGVWMVRMAVAAPAADGGYAPASSVEALDAYIASIDASPPLGLDEEKRALAE